MGTCAIRASRLRGSARVAERSTSRRRHRNWPVLRHDEPVTDAHHFLWLTMNRNPWAAIPAGAWIALAAAWLVRHPRTMHTGDQTRDAAAVYLAIFSIIPFVAVWLLAYGITVL